MAFLSFKRPVWPGGLALAWASGALLVLASWAGPAARSAGMLATTEAVHAAFTLNLTRFITWPAEAFAAPDAPFVIGTFPRQAINDSLDTAGRDEQVNGHPVRTVRLQSLDDIAKCHAIFVSKSDARLTAVLQRTNGKPILTISDAEGFLELGGHVRFVAQPPNIKLSISAINLKRSLLEARAQLLRVAATP